MLRYIVDIGDDAANLLSEITRVIFLSLLRSLAGQ